METTELIAFAIVGAALGYVIFWFARKRQKSNCCGKPCVGESQKPNPPSS